ncbi:DUF308 domain-containing protein [Rhodococcoides fascians A25f]|uniref:DUF308 domain-containing protein n=1 Tax=Rhodococcoides fascians TaxID=1828 RepID=UPI00056D519C|nr:DUF308 domain-containing protein [Rhodococcus fascians]QII05928.1 DUF308 domain-containing protein [Rhodococcus fascians A25f]
MAAIAAITLDSVPGKVDAIKLYQKATSAGWVVLESYTENEGGSEPVTIFSKPFDTQDDAAFGVAILGDDLTGYIVRDNNYDGGMVFLNNPDQSNDTMREIAGRFEGKFDWTGPSVVVKPTAAAGPDRSGPVDEQPKTDVTEHDETDNAELFKLLFAALGEAKSAKSAADYLEAISLPVLAANTWRLATDQRLVKVLGTSADSDLALIARDVLRVRNGLPTAAAADREKAISLNDQKRANLSNDFLKENVKLAKSVVAQRVRWTELSNFVPPFLGVSLIFSGILSIIAFLLTRDHHIDGYQLPLVLFVLALIAVSPSVLLLLERPLRGLDHWSPGGKVEDDAKAEKDEKTEDPAAPDSVSEKEETPVTSRLEIKIVSD